MRTITCLRLTIGLAVVFNGPQLTPISADASVQFSGTCYNVDSGFTLIEFAPR